ncbi:gasdermin [Flavobacterium hercynium]|uniref:Gasdermin bGSDM n=1 Tax=Flavobacterium hercynium TaxID=387094 RepID=A0A226HPF3_9FLAO|nr:hypothetical protein [Flavobacterium hercynium]OXA96085.1 hypothetical protein B0A66_00450 [Flavobacterium hercynium]SMP06352.1 hypothetical protein SAMN06265346_101623 [Flavobacterium hercynium]
MKLTKFLTGQGYDIIEGPVRSHKPLQLWLKKPFDEAQLYYENIAHAFKSDVVLTEIENPALNVNSNQKDDYGFNIGITLLEEILKTLGLGALELSAKIKSGKTVTISYDNSITKEYAIGNLENYFYAADFLHPNPSLLKNANRNHILIITGTIFAKNLIVEIDTDFALDTALLADLNNLAGGKVDFTQGKQNKIKMVSIAEVYFPIAVKASKIDYDRSKFKNLILATDSNNIF